MKLTTIFKNASGIQLMVIPMLYNAKMFDTIELISHGDDMKLEALIEKQEADVITYASITRTFIIKSI